MSAKTKNLYTSLNRQIQIKIKYKEDDDGTLEKGVIFSSLISKKITTPLFDQWNCGQNHEDDRCSKVRQGLFRWSTTYTITFLGKLLQCFFFQIKMKHIHIVKIIFPIVLDQYTFYIRIYANYNIDMPQSRG